MLSLFKTPNNTDNLFYLKQTMEHDYYGKDTPVKLLEVKGMKLDPENRAGESKLMQSCWYDYRDMHPAAKTYLYAELYRQQTLKFYEAMIDIRTLDTARAFTPDDIFMSRDLTSMWLARRMADQHGVPYGFVLRFAQDRFFARVQRTFPRPNQLYGEELEVDMIAAWRERLDRQITYAASLRFRASSWRGELAQAQHVNFVVGQIKARPAPRHTLLARMLNEDVLALPMIASNFSQQESEAAKAYCERFLSVSADSSTL